MEKTKLKKIPKRVWKNVDNGVKFLDALLGRKEWLSRMNMVDFNITTTSKCVAGNVFANGMTGYDNFTSAMELLGLERDGMRFGFLWPEENEAGDDVSQQEAAWLQDAWFSEISRMKKLAKIK